MLDIFVGETAKKQIEQNGFHQNLFDVFLGASGGPKWFTLFGLDKYLFGEFFSNRTQKLNLVGSSAGAFRAACFAQTDPVKAISLLATQYSESDFTKDDSPSALTAKAVDMLEHILTNEGLDNLINNPVFKPHFIVAKTKGALRFENKLLQGSGLVKSILLNRINRSFLNAQYERYVFAPASSKLKVIDSYQIKTHYAELTQSNAKQALLASGAIPMVMQGIKNIPNAPNGMYRDGGIIDYHFDINFNQSGLTLYPHFNSAPKAGWFDKNLSRSPSASNYDRTVMLAPSKEFIQQLPYQKIPDRTDFKNIPTKQRIKYWRQVFADTDMLADSLDQMITKQDLSRLKPLPF